MTRLAIFASLLVLFLVICLQNMEPTSIRILFWRVVEVPKLVLLGSTFALGLGGGVLAGQRLLPRRRGEAPSSDGAV